MSARRQAVVLQPLLICLRSIGAIGPDSRGGVVFGDNVPELRTVLGRRTGHRPSPDKPMRPVDARIVLVPEHRKAMSCCRVAAAVGVSACCFALEYLTVQRAS